MLVDQNGNQISKQDTNSLKKKTIDSLYQQILKSHSLEDTLLSNPVRKCIKNLTEVIITHMIEVEALRGKLTKKE